MPTVREAELRDLPEILNIYAYARRFMAKTGNPNQWSGGYPPKALLQGDINSGQLYVIEENGSVHAVFALIFGPDPTYQKIYGGHWLSSTPYATLHRVAGDGQIKNVLKTAVAFGESKSSHLRIDTHEQNKIMQHLILKNGFLRCGTIYLEDGSPRIAFEKVAE